jgi:hypothetical protein
MGVFQGESSNIYQVLQEPRWNTHKESQPVDEGGEEFHHHYILLGAVIVIGSGSIPWEFSRCPVMLSVRMTV